MARLIVNPSTPQAWEISLKDGANSIGRGDHNDFTIPDDSVSGSHCEVFVQDGTVKLKDLGSTNGTRVEDSPVTDAVLQPGQKIQLGSVEMLFEADVSKPEGLKIAGSSIPIPPPVRMVSPQGLQVAKPPGLKLESSPQPRETAATTFSTPASLRVSKPPPPTLEEAPQPPPEPPRISPPVIPKASTTCKYHPRNLAHWFCAKCRKSYCDLCVNARASGDDTLRLCRTCGEACAELEIQVARPVEIKFFAEIPKAFTYPLNGDGMILLVTGTLFFMLIDSLKWFSRYGGYFAWGAGGLIAVFGAGYLMTYLRCILLDSSEGKSRMPDWPEFTDFNDIISPARQTLCVWLFCFAPVIALLIWGSPETIAWGIIPAVIFGCLYFPMAFLTVSMYDTVAAVNPMLVLPSIVKLPLQYLVVCALLAIIVAIYWVTKIVLSVAIPIPILPMAVAGFFNLYLLAIEMRILGLLYLANKP